MVKLVFGTERVFIVLGLSEVLILRHLRERENPHFQPLHTETPPQAGWGTATAVLSVGQNAMAVL